MWGRHFDRYYFRPSTSTLTPQIGGGVELGAPNVTLELWSKLKWRQIEQKFVLTGIGKSWVFFSIGANPNPLMLP